MAEKIISPGVFTKEIDASFLPSAVGNIGAAIVGPTVKGPAMVPTVVSSYSEFQAKFGDEFASGSNNYTYLTSIAAQQYLRHSNKLTVVRVLDGTFNGANATVLTSGSTAATGVNKATGSMRLAGAAAVGTAYKITEGSNEFKFISSGDGGGDSSDDSIRFFVNGADLGAHTTNLVAEINAVSGLNVTAVSSSNGLELSASSAGTAANGITFQTASAETPSTFGTASAFLPGQSPELGLAGFMIGGGTQTAGTSETAFKLHTHADGAIMNSSGSDIVMTGTSHQLVSGSKDNIRWEISSVNKSKGTFTLLIRRGNDTIGSKQILETHTDLSLDPNEPNYIGKRIGDSYADIQDKTGADPYVSYVGTYPNKSDYVYVSTIKDTPRYLDESGVIRDNSQSGSLPDVGSGSAYGAFGGGLNGVAGFDSLGNVSHTGAQATAVAYNFYDNINATNSQGFSLDSIDEEDGGVGYTAALKLLNNADEYDINLLLLPGIVDSLGGAHTGIITKAVEVCENRGDCFLIYDTVGYSEQTIANVTSKASDRNSNYAATYWPWVQIADPANGNYRWVPPSTVLSGIYAFNDKIAAPWFAPAGLNRGGLDTVVQASRKLTHANRDTLYESNVNPIATFPGQGVCVWGQKTLQKKSSALDRVNVRRLMIKVKKFISASSRFLVFEQNNASTRERFLNIVNPYLEQVQSQSGLSAFKVVMDESNNTPDLVDRNILYGQLFLQPTRTAEFIVLDFTIQPTGASFPE
tara:strand:+ start:545 stop:2797 length:2253 start_codon:yes stop_codon:yes gene_type:complete